MLSASDPIGLAGGGGAAATAPNPYSALSSEQFLKILMTELSNQDPMQPTDSKAMLEQLSSIRNIQSSMDLQSQLKALVGQNELASAAGLIGRQVSGIDDAGLRVSGRVEAVSRGRDGPVLRLANGETLRMSQFDRVLEGAEPVPASTGTSGPATGATTPQATPGTTGVTP